MSVSPHTPADTPPSSSLLLLDGGTGHLLKEWGVRLPGLPIEQQFLAGVLANESDPHVVQRVHSTYIAAGSRCITTNSFVATRHSLAKLGRKGDVGMLAAAAARNAAAAREGSGVAGVLVAGSLPPLQESYQTEGLDTPDDMRQQYREIAEALSRHVDVFLAETLSTSQEAQAAAEATADMRKPLWISFTLQDSAAALIRSGEALGPTAAALLQRHPHIKALLLNCSAPAAVTAALPAMYAAAAPAGVRIGAYANGFRTTTTEWLSGGQGPRLEVAEGDYEAGSGIITPAGYARHCAAWRSAGASMIGGCCGVGPEHIRAVGALLGH